MHPLQPRAGLWVREHAFSHDVDRLLVQEGDQDGFARHTQGFVQGLAGIVAKFQESEQGDDVEFLVLEGQVFGPPEVQVRLAAHAISCQLEHGRRGVQAGHVEPAFPEELQKTARPAADFKKPLRPPGPGSHEVLQKAFLLGQGEGAVLGFVPAVIGRGLFTVDALGDGCLQGSYVVGWSEESTAPRAAEDACLA